MSDATENAANAGEDVVADFIGDKDPAGAVRWYGLYSFASGLGSIFAYMMLNGNTWVATFDQGFRTRMAFYFPVAMCWIMVSLFDGE